MGARQFPVPAVYQYGVLGSAATLDEIDYAATAGNPWASKVLAKENARFLDGVLQGSARLPVGVLDGDAVVGLWRDGQGYAGHGWNPMPVPPPDLIDLDADTVAFVARALQAQSPAILYPYTPLAVIGAKAAPGKQEPAGVDLPEGTKVIAVVDEYDKNAVLDTVAVLPGPKTLRRHDHKWVEDPGWVSVLRSVRPPPVVVLSGAQIPDVLDQIDQSTAGQPFTPTKLAKTASGLLARADEMVIEWAIVGADPVSGKVLSKVTPGGRMPHELMTYWAYGPGAAKIRWGTPGAMTRCARHLAKYVGPHRAYPTCNNIGKRLGGKGVAWDVG